jgi:hypothetical protein
MPNPVSGGRIGRTDQGVDISASPGAALYDPVPGTSRLVGVIQNWFQGQPFYYFQVVSGPFKGAYWYVAEQVRSRLGVGQQVSQGQQVGTYAPSGTATEWGWATSTGQTRARATTGYTEGQVTPAGTSFLNQIIKGRSNVRGVSLHVPNYVPPKYVNLIRQAARGTGMPASVVAAQIQDESSFDPNSVSPTGAQGIAQFEPGTWKTYGSGSPFNPQNAMAAYTKYMSTLLKQYNGNIRDALAAYNAGPGNLAAGYGYADSILSKAGLSSTATAGSPSAYGGTRPGGQPANAPQDTGQGIDAVLTAYETTLQTPRTAPSPTGNDPSSGFSWSSPFQWFWNSFTGNWQSEMAGGVGAGGAQAGQQAQSGAAAAGAGAASGVASAAGS